MRMLGMFMAGVFAASAAHATGLGRTVYQCAGGSGEDAATVFVQQVSMSPPGGPVRQWYEGRATASWLGGTHDSGKLLVRKAAVEGSDAVAWTNREQKFELVVHKVDQNRQGKVHRIDVEGKFQDAKTRLPGTIRRRWLDCK